MDNSQRRRRLRSCRVFGGGWWCHFPLLCVCTSVALSSFFFQKSLLPECVYSYVPPEPIPVCPYTSAELEEQELLLSLSPHSGGGSSSSLSYPPGYWEFQELQRLLLFSFKTPPSKTSLDEWKSRARGNHQNLDEPRRSGQQAGSKARGGALQHVHGDEQHSSSTTMTGEVVLMKQLRVDTQDLSLLSLSLPVLGESLSLEWHS